MNKASYRKIKRNSKKFSDLSTGATLWKEDTVILSSVQREHQWRMVVNVSNDQSRGPNPIARHNLQFFGYSFKERDFTSLVPVVKF